MDWTPAATPSGGEAITLEGASATKAPTARIPKGIGGIVGMAVRAVRLLWILPSDIIYAMRDGLQMRGIDARGHPAQMIQFQAWRDRPVNLLIGPSVGAEMPRHGQRKDAIAQLMMSAGPQPAGRAKHGMHGSRPIDFHPKPLGGRAALITTALRAKTSALHHGAAPTWRKHDAAPFTYSQYWMA